ncbi:MAG: outer membrane protein OmpA-like peptidoglycan-associated protein [Verrucomicrobiales bacterium]|jgi:outer membrane protein OmpA-like peptidoglycan-associated protein
MPVLAIVGAVGLSVIVFFVFTLPQFSGKKDGDEEVVTGGDPVETGTGEIDKPPAFTPEPEPEPQPEPEPEPSVIEKFANPRALVESLVKRIVSGDPDSVKSLVGDEVLAQPRALGFMHAFGEGGYVPSPNNPFAEIGDVDEANRWALYVVPKNAIAGDTPAERITVDVMRAPEVGWKVGGVHVPSSLRKAAIAAGVTLPDGSSDVGGVELDRGDPLFVADDFVSSLLSQDFERALELCGEKVPDEKIAGLCMVFEEGEFRMVKEKPLTTTSLPGRSAAWVYARVRSDKLGTNGDFAVELKKVEDKGWQVENVNIESMLEDFVKGSEAGRVPFSPIKKNPDGGETLVLYFEYDQAELLPRSLRQIDILARILKADPKKNLNIGGHADALGTDEYNRRLSEARGIAVRNALIMFGVPESQILVTAHGEAKPWKKNTSLDGTDNPEGRQHNRRAEIYLNF